MPVAMVDSGIDGDAPVASIITDQYKGGFMAGEEMAKLLDEQGPGRQPRHPGRLGERRAAARASRGHRPVPGHEGAARRSGPTADAAKSLNIATDEITANPDLAGFFTPAPRRPAIAQAVKAKGIDKAR